MLEDLASTQALLAAKLTSIEVDAVTAAADEGIELAAGLGSGEAVSALAEIRECVHRIGQLVHQASTLAADTTRILYGMTALPYPADSGPGPSVQGRWTAVRPPLSTPQQRRIHILSGDDTGGGHRFGTRLPGKTEFPERWDDEATLQHILDVAKSPDSFKLQDNGRWRVSGMRDGVDIVVAIQPDGRIWTAYPRKGRGVGRNPRKKADS